jgi:hypothetical protein
MEWEQVVDAWQLNTWEAYRDVVRLGRKTRLPEPQRAILWSIFEEVRSGLLSRKVITRPGMFTKLAAAIAVSKNPPFNLPWWMRHRISAWPIFGSSQVSAYSVKTRSSLQATSGSASFSSRFRG